MRLTSFTRRAVILAAAVGSLVTGAQAIPIPNGTMGTVDIGQPTVDLSQSLGTYTASMDRTAETFGVGGFQGVSGLYGIMNGVLQFSSVYGTTVNQTIADFFKFDDAHGGFYDFSVSSVLTRNYADTPGVSTSIGLYLLGTTLDTNLNLDPTPTSLTLTFNSSAGSNYTASATLAVPPAPIDVPEPLSLALLGTGLVTIGFVRRMRTLEHASGPAARVLASAARPDRAWSRWNGHDGR